MKTQDKKKRDQIEKALKGLEFVDSVGHKFDIENRALYIMFYDKAGKMFQFGYNFDQNGNVDWKNDTPETVKLGLPVKYYAMKDMKRKNIL